MGTTMNLEAVTLEEYLGTSYKPDRDFVRGELQERNLGERDHSEMQLTVLLWFVRHAAEWKIAPLPEMRVQTGSENYRIADIAIVSSEAPRERVLLTPPEIVIEILSPEDRIQRYEDRLDDYRAMGVRNIWVIDPRLNRGFNCSSGDWVRCDRFEIANSPIYLSLLEL
jgi:Uma2 family endonuclease